MKINVNIAAKERKKKKERERLCTDKKKFHWLPPINLNTSFSRLFLIFGNLHQRFYKKEVPIFLLLKCIYLFMYFLFQELDLLQSPKPFIFTLHTFLSAKVMRLGLVAWQLQQWEGEELPDDGFGSWLD